MIRLLSSAIARARSLWRGIGGRAASGAEMEEEFRLHIELRADDLVRQGVPEHEAMRRARAEFGSTEWYKDEGRRARGLRPFDDLRFSLIDLRLGARMLARYPGITLVGGLAMAFAIWVGASAFELVGQVLAPRIPLPGGERIVALRNWDVAASRPEDRALRDFAAWREGLSTVEDLGAYRTLQRNLVVADGDGAPAEVAEITASAFALARVRPALGRTLVAGDERPGAPDVVLLGHDVWMRRFGGDSAVVGRVVRLGRVPSTVVGVMPEGFGFPVAQSLWVPLRLSAADAPPREGARIRIFGRLAPGATLDDARAELATLGRRAAADFPETHAQLRPTVVPYAKSIVDVSGWRSLALASVNLPLLLLLVLVCGNVALLLFARAASREGELVVRSALGASRGRLVMQLFAEALVLGGVAAALGLLAAEEGVRWVFSVVEAEFLNGGRLPFWFVPRLSPATVLYAVALTLLAAVVCGVVPALKVTRGMGTRLKESSAGGGGMRFGGIWTAVIVSQIAVTLVFPVFTWFVRRDALQIRRVDVGVPAGEYLTLRLEMDRETGDGAAADTSRARFLARYRAAYAELARRLEKEPGVAGVAFADRLPRMYHPHRLIEVDEGGAAPLDPHWPAYRVSSASVAPGYFETFDAPILAGRPFTAADHAAERGAPGDSGARGGPVIVNQSFVRLVLGGRNPVGRRLRYVLLEEREPRRLEEPSPWYEIVGVVRDLGMSIHDSASIDPKIAGIYHPVAGGAVYPGNVAVRVRGGAAAFAPALRELALAIDPTLRLYDVRPLSEMNDAELQFISFWFRLLLGASAIALTLSLAGIYAVMSFTVARRTREIGIRVALGAPRRRVVMAIFRRPLIQVALGIVTGAAVMEALFLWGDPDRALRPAHLAGLLGYAAVMMLVCLAACVVPTVRALRVEPTEALREE